MKELSRKEMKKLGIRLPKKTRLWFTESDTGFTFTFEVPKVKRKEQLLFS